MASRPLERYHERTRRRGVNPFVYWPVRWLVKPAILVYFRLRRLGTEHVPEGGVILASNHRSFLDPFAIGCCIGRPIYFVAKRELSLLNYTALPSLMTPRSCRENSWRRRRW